MARAKQLPELAAWLTRVCKAEKPPKSVVAFNVGLFETADGFSAYLIGANRYDDEDTDWACEEAFTPIQTFLGCAGTLDDERLAVLDSCNRELAIVVLQLNGEGKEYFSRLEKLTRLVLKTVRDGGMPGRTNG